MRSTVYPIIGLIFFSLTSACDEECVERSQTVVLSGEILYPRFQSGVIDLRVYESVSMECGSQDPATAKSPGELLRRQRFDAPGPFMLLTDITWTGKDPMKPEIVIVARLYGDGVIDGGPCDAGFLMQLPAADYTDMQIVLEQGSCQLSIE